MTSRIDRITQQRLEKLARIRARGIEPYPHRYRRSHTTQEAVEMLQKSEAGTPPQATPDAKLAGPKPGAPSATVAGRVTARRNMGKIVFMDLRDSSGKIQLLFGDLISAEQSELLKDIDIGDIIGATGRLFRTKTNEPTIAVSDFTLLAKALQPLPEKWHGLSDVELRYRQRYLDLISNP
ncbi:MAG: lysine--tRNA ligase, partial [Chloroflexi bacterium]|nr:lysine--tRNA ligase [Chloroflexota bacterium]